MSKAENAVGNESLNSFSKLKKLGQRRLDHLASSPMPPRRSEERIDSQRAGRPEHSNTGGPPEVELLPSTSDRSAHQQASEASGVEHRATTLSMTSHSGSGPGDNSTPSSNGIYTYTSSSSEENTAELIGDPPISFVATFDRPLPAECRPLWMLTPFTVRLQIAGGVGPEGRPLPFSVPGTMNAVARTSPVGAGSNEGETINATAEEVHASLAMDTEWTFILRQLNFARRGYSQLEVTIVFIPNVTTATSRPIRVANIRSPPVRVHSFAQVFPTSRSRTASESF